MKKKQTMITMMTHHFNFVKKVLMILLMQLVYLRILTGKIHSKYNSSAFEKYEYGHTPNQLFIQGS